MMAPSYPSPAVYGHGTGVYPHPVQHPATGILRLDDWWWPDLGFAASHPSNYDAVPSGISEQFRYGQALPDPHESIGLPTPWKLALGTALGLAIYAFWRR